MRTIEVMPGETSLHEGRRQWDITPHVREIVAKEGSKVLLVMLCARNCHGCDVLSRQLEKLGPARGDAVRWLKAIGGDLETGDFIRDLRLGTFSIFTPGVPLALLFDTSTPGSLFLRSLALGPLDERAPERALEDLFDGRSQWVPEAQAVTLPACAGSLCVSLAAANGFHAPLTVSLGA